MMETLLTGKPTPFIVCTVMWFLHGIVLDICIIGVLPVLAGGKTADAMFYNGKLVRRCLPYATRPRAFFF